MKGLIINLLERLLEDFKADTEMLIQKQAEQIAEKEEQIVEQKGQLAEKDKEIARLRELLEKANNS